ncbi:MAG TPA: NAD(P)/FAD-dependent oxidoreductase [Luteimonas sp.]|nr:NAD(P)/FAD-dependent oxidoreductase [Luteimonas sp.]
MIDTASDHPGSDCGIDDSPAAVDRVVETDVLVIGGGPAGSTTATLLARRGWKVLLLEKARHPRFHIGESLLPMNIPILERLGVLDRVREIGVLKRGADFPVEGGNYNVFRFDRALRDGTGYAFHVKREEFDQLLFEHARTEGVDARDGVKVERVEFDADGRPRLLQARDGAGAFDIRARYVVDASGRDALFGSRLGLKQRNKRHQSAAVFSHFHNVPRRAGEDAGNVTICRHEHGWLWLIPLHDGTTSVGAVCSPELMKQRRGETEAFLMRTLNSVEASRERMRDAVRAGPVHVTGNYAYDCSRMSGPGWSLVGDAWTFVDPMFSSGVFLAMNHAEQAADAIDQALREPAREAALMHALERHLTGGLKEFKWFIYRFTSPTMKRLFASPRNVLQVEQAVISMLAGDVFDARPVLWRLRIFRVIYAVTALRIAPSAIRSWWQRRRDIRRGMGESMQAETTP